jgi:hypothetical protein
MPLQMTRILEDRFVSEALTLTGGFEIMRYRQLDDARIALNDITKEGWCFGMVIHWLRFMKAGGDFWEWFYSTDGRLQVHAAMARQKIIVKQGAAADKDAKYLSYMRRFGIPGCDSLTSHQLAFSNDWMGIGEAVQDLNYKFFAINIHYADGTAHAVAAYKPGLGRFVKWLDPDLGEFQFPTGELYNFLSGLEAAGVRDKLDEHAAFWINFGQSL